MDAQFYLDLLYFKLSAHELYTFNLHIFLICNKIMFTVFNFHM